MQKLHGGRVLLTALLLGLGYLLVLIYRISHYAPAPPRSRADVIIVLGAAQADGKPMPVLQARLRHAIELYQCGDAPYLLFAGGGRPGDRFTEAETGHKYAVAHGVPADAILLENAGRTTWQSMQLAADIMRRHHFRHAILVSDPYHGFRLTRMAQDLQIDATFSATPYAPYRRLQTKAKYVLREMTAYAVYRILGM